MQKKPLLFFSILREGEEEELTNLLAENRERDNSSEEIFLSFFLCLLPFLFNPEALCHTTSSFPFSCRLIQGQLLRVDILRHPTHDRQRSLLYQRRESPDCLELRLQSREVNHCSRNRYTPLHSEECLPLFFRYDAKKEKRRKENKEREKIPSCLYQLAKQNCHLYACEPAVRGVQSQLAERTDKDERS